MKRSSLGIFLATRAGITDGVISLASSNPFGFLLIVIGAALFFGILFGIAILVSFLALLLIGMVFPAILFVLGLWWVSHGRVNIGLLAIAVAIIMFLSQAWGWVRF